MKIKLQIWFYLNSTPFWMFSWFVFKQLTQQRQGLGLKVAPWKKLFLNFVNTNKNNLQFHPFLPKFPILYPLETLENVRFSDVYRGYKKGTLGWNELKSLTCFFSIIPFCTPWKYQKIRGYFDNFRGYEIGTLWKNMKQNIW